MRALALWIILGTGALTAQLTGDRTSTTALSRALMALQDRGAELAPSIQQVADEIMWFAEDAHRPSRGAVERFTKMLCAALSGRRLPARDISRLATAIVEVMHSAGTSTFRFKASVSRAELALASLGVPVEKAHAVAERLAMVGKEVRGPDDIPLE